MFITHKMVTWTRNHEFVVEASSLGWRPGEWPTKADTNMGNGLPFLLWSATENYRIYRQANGVLVLRVFND
jgi:hypothetical protein